MPNPNPIGIFDSGVGGLSVLKEIRRMLPDEKLLYYADSAHCPYGTKPPEEIRRRIIKISEFLVSHHAKMIVSACNTASIAGLDFLREVFRIPIVGMEPAIKPAAAITRNGKVGVMATGVTIAGERFNSLLTRFANGIEVYNVACPGLVERVEMGLLNDPETEELIRYFLTPLTAQQIDTLVLGCTHYPFLRPLVEKIMGPGVKVIDTGCAVAKRVKQVLQEEGLQNNIKASSTEIIYTSADLAKASEVIKNLWDHPFPEIYHIKL